MANDPPDDPDDERSDRDRQLYAAVLFRIKENLEKLARERGKLNPPRLTRTPKKVQISPLRTGSGVESLEDQGRAHDGRGGRPHPAASPCRISPGSAAKFTFHLPLRLCRPGMLLNQPRSGCCMSSPVAGYFPCSAQ